MITIYDYSKLKVVKHFKLAKSYTWLTVHVNTTSNPPNKQGTQNKKSGFDINIERTLNHRMNVITARANGLHDTDHSFYHDVIDVI